MTDERERGGVTAPGAWQICPLCDRASEARLVAQVTRLLQERYHREQEIDELVTLLGLRVRETEEAQS